MLKSSLSVALLLAMSAPVAAAPVCYMDTVEGDRIDLSYMCGGGSGDVPQSTPAAASPVNVEIGQEEGVNIVASNSQFENDYWNATIGDWSKSSEVEGRVYNFGDAVAKNIEIEIWADNATHAATTRQYTIRELRPDGSADVSVVFPFVPDTFDVRVIGWD